MIILVSNYTVWKFQDFSITHILRQINFWDARSIKTVVFAFLGGRFYLHKEAQNAQIAQTVVNFQKFFEDSICTKTILFAQRKFYLHKENSICTKRYLKVEI